MSVFRVLLVDEKGASRRALRAMLEALSLGLRVVDVPSGEEGILEFQRQAVDLLVSEIKLPGISGLELMQKLRSRKADLKVILIAASGDARLEQALQEARVDAFLRKPLVAADLQQAVKRCLALPDIIEEAAGEEGMVQSLSARLADLRAEMAANAVLLFNERGHIMAQAGHVADFTAESALILALVAAVSASQKVSRFVAKGQANPLLFFDGSPYNLILAPLGQMLSLCLVTSHPIWQGDYHRAITVAIEEIKPALTAMGLELEEKSALVEPPLESEAAVLVDVEGVDDALENILQQATSRKLGVSEVEAFWDTLVNREQVDSPRSADLLSYEQAIRLGLSPDSE